MGSFSCDDSLYVFQFRRRGGAGKSTQIRLLADAPTQRGREVVTCRDPGSTPLGDQLRSILLDHHDTPIHRRAEMLLYMASRAQLVEQVIRPALAAGKIVISDRYLLANIVYQAHAGGLNPSDVWQVGQITVAGIMPRLVFLLDMPAELASRRIQRCPIGLKLRDSLTLSKFGRASWRRPATGRRKSLCSTPTGRRKPFTPTSCAKSSECFARSPHRSAARRE